LQDKTFKVHLKLPLLDPGI